MTRNNCNFISRALLFAACVSLFIPSADAQRSFSLTVTLAFGASVSG